MPPHLQALKALNLHLEACWATQLTGADDSVGGGGGFGSLGDHWQRDSMRFT